MKILQNVRASEKQEEVIYVGTEAHIYLNEREIEINTEDKKSIQYEYDKVIIENARAYNDLVTIARFEYCKEYLDKTDHKIYPHYTPKDGENVEDIISKRYEAVRFIREHK